MIPTIPFKRMTPLVDMLPQTIILPPPCFTVGVRNSLWNVSSYELRTYFGKRKLKLTKFSLMIAFVFVIHESEFNISLQLIVCIDIFDNNRSNETTRKTFL